LPFPTWVVRQVDVTDGRGTTSTAEYTYQDPVYATDEPFTSDASPFGPEARFRGFQAVTTKLPQLVNETPATHPALFERLSYRESPDGLLDYKALMVGSQKLTIDQTTYIAESMFGGAVRYAHPQATKHVECDPSVGNCDTQTTFVTQKFYGYLAYPTTTAPLLFTQETDQETTTGANAPTSRIHIANHLILDDAQQYLILTTRKVDQSAAGPVLSRQDLFYDGSTSVDGCGSSFGTCKGALTKVRSYRDPS